MKLLDLFCGAGGCSKGYSNAGFEVIGVDIVNQPNYLYSFIKTDAIEYLQNEDLSKFDLIHASPPCQAYSWSSAKHDKNWHDYIQVIRNLLIERHVDYVIENVVGAPLFNPIILEGPMFGLKVIRKRLFETNWELSQPERCLIRYPVKKRGYCTPVGHGCNGPTDYLSWSLALGINWMTKEEMTQAIPPAYTEYIGNEYLSAMDQAECY